MAQYLKYFTTVGDDHQPVEWEDQELHVTSEELSPATGQFPTKPTFRDSLKKLYSSDRFQVLVVCLVILDAIFVLVELLIDLSFIRLEHDHTVAEVFHYMSLALLTFFMVELAGKLFAYRLEFFQHKFEVFDGVVVVVSFVLDLVFLFHEDAFDGMGLIILLRLWRVARIINVVVYVLEFGYGALQSLVCTLLWKLKPQCLLPPSPGAGLLQSAEGFDHLPPQDSGSKGANSFLFLPQPGILVSVKTRADLRIHKLKDSYDHLVQRVTELQQRADKLEQEKERLQGLLKKHGIEF